MNLVKNNSTDPVIFESDNNKYWGTKNYDFTQGGGITVFFEKNRAKSVVIIDNCKIYQNQANWGGGMIIVVLNDFSDHSEKSKLIVQNSVIAKQYLPTSWWWSRHLFLRRNEI